MPSVTVGSLPAVNIAGTPRVEAKPRPSFLLDTFVSIPDGKRYQIVDRNFATTQRIVIEQLSGFCNWPLGQNIVLEFNVFSGNTNDPQAPQGWQYMLLPPLTIIPSIPPSTERHTGVLTPLLMRMYGEPLSGNVSFSIEFARDSTIGEMDCRLQAVGYYEDCAGGGGGGGGG